MRDVVSNLGSARTGTGEDEMWRLEVLRVEGIVPLPDIFGFYCVDDVLFLEQDSDSLMTSFCLVRPPSGEELLCDSRKTIQYQYLAVPTRLRFDSKAYSVIAVEVSVFSKALLASSFFCLRTHHNI